MTKRVKLYMCPRRPLDVLPTCNHLGDLTNGQSVSVKWHFHIFLLIVTFHVALLAWGASRQSPTFNEPAHLVAGISNLEFGRFEMYRENPPLVRMIAALPVLAVGYKSDWSGFENTPGARPAFAMGERFAEANGRRLMLLFTFARWACIPFSIIGAWTCYRWSTELAGSYAGLIAAALWCGSPEILGHGQLITPDVPATALGFLACYIYWRWLQQSTWQRAILSGAILGIAELTKTTLILLYLVWPLTWIAVRLWQKRTMNVGRSFSEIIMLAVQILISINVINLGYGFEGSFQRLDTFQFVSKYFSGRSVLGDTASNSEIDNGSSGNRFVGTYIGRLPVPLPRNFVTGVDIQQADFEHFGRPSYLRGTFQQSGWWYYYLYGLIFKTPLALWGLAITAVICRIRQKRVHRNSEAEFILLVVPTLILVVASAKCGFSHHMRYILPCLPFFICWIAVTLVTPLRRLKNMLVIQASACFVPILAFLLTVLFWTESLFVYPHSLSYFNAFAGGPFGGPRYLLGSNVDWGQDLSFLIEKLRRVQDKDPIFVAYWGGSDPRYYGIADWQPIGTSLIPGYYAISVNTLYGDPYPIRNGGETDGLVPQALLQKLIAMERYDSAGYSIYIYHIVP